MKKLLLALLLLASSAFATTIPQAANIAQFGGLGASFPFINIPIGAASNVVTLIMGSGGVTAGHFYEFIKANSPGSTTQYQVPSGKTFTAYGIMFESTLADSTILGYGTAALASEDTATPPTGVVYYAATSTGATFITHPASAYQSIPISVSFPALSYPFAKAISSSHDLNIMLIGQEL